MTTNTRMVWLATCVVATALHTMSSAEAQVAASTGAVTIVDELAFPEAPLFVNDKLHLGCVNFIATGCRISGTSSILREGCPATLDRDTTCNRFS